MFGGFGFFEHMTHGHVVCDVSVLPRYVRPAHCYCLASNLRVFQSVPPYQHMHAYPYLRSAYFLVAITVCSPVLWIYPSIPAHSGTLVGIS